MHIEIGNLIGEIASSTQGILADFSPIFSLVIGITLAFYVIGEIVYSLTQKKELDSKHTNDV